MGRACLSTYNTRIPAALKSNPYVVKGGLFETEYQDLGRGFKSDG
ncbi:hypothetical protein D515_03993 [Grimontia indica]|uniref:Uncharacterized protein n=1 Tax=Grimontia indica TaxID=1056512 RepID=R1GMJ6_9GAMM|nr:hypothetical protein D515_03993 [Grimontia indica]